MTNGAMPHGAAMPGNSGMERWLPVALLWQALLGLAGLGGAAWLAVRALTQPGSNLLLWLAATIVGVAGVAGLGAIPLLRRGVHRGRVMALVVNYLAFLATGFYTLHRLGVFLALDSLADRFGGTLPFLALVAFGYLLTTWAERLRSPAQAELLRQIGLGLMVVFSILTLWAGGLVPGALALVQRLASSPLTVALAVVTLVLGVALAFWWRTETAVAFGATITQNEMLNGYLLLSPNLLGFLIFFAGPLLFSLYVSFTEWSAFGSPTWVGLGNYTELFSFDLATLAAPTQRAGEVLAPGYVELTRFALGGTSYVLGTQDKLFWIALRNTFLYCLMVVPLSVIPALLLSNVLNSKIPGMKFFRAVYFLPSVAAVVGVASIWDWLYNSTSGFINYGLVRFVDLLNAVPGVALEAPQPRWLSSSDTALFAIVIMAAWRIVGFNTVLFLAGLQGISTDVYEAAAVDGAGALRKFRSITLPLLAPTTFFVITTTIIQALQLFDEVFVMMNPPAGPNNSTLTAVLYLYQNGFQRFNLGYASAVAWALFGFIFLVTLVQFRVQRAGAEGN